MKQVQVGSRQLKVVESGSGPPLLLVHGFPLDHTMWLHQIKALRADYHVIAPDLPGFGRNSPVEGTLTMAACADDLSDLLRTLEVDQPITFCGLSMGGYIGWEFWDRHADQLGRLILCDTRAAADSAEAAKQRLRTADRILRDGNSGFLADQMVDKLFSKSSREGNRVVSATAGIIREAAPSTVAAALRGMAERRDFQDRLAEVDIPCLVVCGSEDAITPLEEMRTMAEAIPTAEFVEVSEAGHMAPLEQPTVVNAAIQKFLEG